MPDSDSGSGAGSDLSSMRAAGEGSGATVLRRPAPEVIVALDYPEEEAAWGLVNRLPPGTWCKVGLELFTRCGPGFVKRLAWREHPILLDLKLHDIPTTVAGAVRSVAGLGVRLLTVHASGGAAMLRAAVESAQRGSELRILAVTVLTSLDDGALADVMGSGVAVEEAVGRLAGLARESGVHGAVASVAECRAIKLSCGEEFLVATPGIRLAGDAEHDQKRVARPSVARDAGADFLVVGRSVTGAADPLEALRRVRLEAGAQQG
ncbi:MAG: orotidine-5'-phosphate decarboxylase [Gemmatimonadota bacterium]